MYLQELLKGIKAVDFSGDKLPTTLRSGYSQASSSTSLKPFNSTRELTRAVFLNDYKKKVVLGLADDSRLVGENFLFCAIKGIRLDGHAFIKEAITRGANVIVVEKLPRDVDVKGITVVRVADSREALGVIASNFNGNPSKKMEVLGVTGTKGKTTSAFFLYQLLSKLGKKAGLISSVSAIIGDKVYDTGFHVTNPDCISLHGFLKKMFEEGCEYAVIEVSSHGIHQKRIAGINFAGTVLTNIAPEHLDYHKTFEKYRDVKLSFLKSGRLVVLNKEDANFNYLKSKIPVSSKLLSYALNTPSDMNLNDIPEIKKLPGDFNKLNALGATSMLVGLGFKLEDIRKHADKLYLPEGRLEEIKNNLGIKIIVDFAHTPDSLENTLVYLKKESKGKLVALFGSAGERDPYKRPLMGKIGSELADMVVLTAEDSRSESVYDIMAQIKSGVSENNLNKVFEIADRREAIKFALSKAKKGDTVGIFGKGHETSMNLDGKTEIPWSDKKEIEVFLTSKS